MEIYNALEKPYIPTCNIMGVNIAAINMPWLLTFTQEHIKELSGDYMCVANVHTTVTAYEDEQYRNIQNGGIMAIPDGGPLSTVGRKRGYKDMCRTTGPSYMEQILKVSVEKDYSHYFYGSTDETLKKLYKVLQSTYPGIRIAGMYSPPFRRMNQDEDEAIISRINEANPDFIWVGLGAPKQERWMAAHQGKVKGFMVGVGAGFDYLAGNLERAPEWMQKNNMEWLFRFLQEPKRLFSRYWHNRNDRKPVDGRILYVGSMVKRKGLDLLIEALRHVRSEFQLHIVGNGTDTQKNELHDQVEAAGLEHKIEWRGFREGHELVKEYLEASIFVLPTREDCFGLVLLEAFFAGVPIVSSMFADGAYDIIAPNVNGILIDPFDAISFARGIDLALTERRFAENAANMDKTKFSYASCSRGYKKAICISQK